VTSACKELIEEQHRLDLLRSHNLEPRHRVLLAGPPGNGKTSLAEVIATELMVPLLVVRYEAVIASYLGETAVRLARLFDHVRTCRAVLFFDEFDVVGKELEYRQYFAHRNLTN
jgi:SpoVK/Ycf46/Vps4 family AAA+-type ATPase